MNAMIDEQVTTTTTKSAGAQPKEDDEATQHANTARRRPLPIHCECAD